MSCSSVKEKEKFLSIEGEKKGRVALAIREREKKLQL